MIDCCPEANQTRELRADHSTPPASSPATHFQDVATLVLLELALAYLNILDIPL